MCPIYINVSMRNILRVVVNSVWVYFSSRGVRPFCILTAPDDYIPLFFLLSFALSPRLFLPVSSLHPRAEERIPSERN